MVVIVRNNLVRRNIARYIAFNSGMKKTFNRDWLFKNVLKSHFAVLQIRTVTSFFRKIFAVFAEGRTI